MAAAVGMLALTALSATLEVVIESAVGVFLAHKSILDIKSTRALTNIGYYVTLPSMNLYRLASGVSLEMMKTVWIVSVYSIIFIFMANTIARIVFIRRFWGSRIPSAVEQTMYIFAVTFSNSVSIPVVFVGALCSSSSTLFADPEAALSKAVAFISIYSITNSVSFWTYGLSTMKKMAAVKRSLELAAPVTPEITITPLPASLPTEIVVQTEVATPTTPPPTPSWTQHAKEKLQVAKTDIISGIKSLFTPPMIALGLGITIACIGPVKTFLVTSPPPIISTIMNTAKLFSGSTFALTMMILGSNLYATFTKPRNNERQTLRVGLAKYVHFIPDRFMQHNDPIALIVCVCLKLIVMPLMGIGIVVGSVYLGLLPRQDSVLLLVLLVEASAPTAINLNNIANLADGVGQDQTSEILLFIYSCAPISLSIFSTVYLHLLESLVVVQTV